MTAKTPSETNNLDIYGHEALEWGRAAEALELSKGPDVTHFLGTCRTDGTPHAAGVGAQWRDGELYFTSSPGARKSRDLAENPKCTLSVSLPGIDLVMEGSAVRITDAATLEAVAVWYRDSGWPCEVDGEALTAPFSAPSAGPPPWYVYRLDYHTVVGVASEEPQGATKWSFA